MSMWTSFTKAVRGVASAGLAKLGLKAIPGVGAALTAYDLAKMAGKVTRGGSRAVRAIPGKGYIAAGAAGAYAGSRSGGGTMIDGQYRKRRRMNYANVKAANRAIRRIKGTRKLLQKIEKQLPHKIVHSRKRA